MARRRAASPGPPWSVLEGMCGLSPSSTPLLNMQNEAATKRKVPAANIPANKPPKKMAKADDRTRPTSTNSADTLTSPPTQEPGRKTAILLGPPDASPTPSTRSSEVRRMRATLPLLLEDTRKQPRRDVPPQRQNARRAVQRNATPGPSMQPAEVRRTRSYTSMVANKKKRPRSPDSEDNQTPPPTVSLAKWLSTGIHRKKDVVSSENRSVKILNTPNQRTRRLAKKQKSTKEVIELFSSSEDEMRPRKRRRHTTQIMPCSKSPPSGAIIDLCSDDEDALSPAELTPSRKNTTRTASAPKPIAKVPPSSSREPHISRRSARQNKVFMDDTNDESSTADDLPAIEVHPTPATNRTSNIAHEVVLPASPATSKRELDAQIAINPPHPPSPHATTEESAHHMHDDFAIPEYDPDTQREQDVPHDPTTPVFSYPPLLQPDDQEEQEPQAALFLSTPNMQPRAASPRPTEAEPPPRVPSPQATQASNQEEWELQDASPLAMSDMQPSLNSCHPAEAEPSRASSPDLTRAPTLLPSSLLDAYRQEERDLEKAVLRSVLDASMNNTSPDVDSSDGSSSAEPLVVQHDDESSIRDPLPAATAPQMDLSSAYNEEQDPGAAMRSLENTMLMSTSDVKPNSESPRHTAVASRVPSPEPPVLSSGHIKYDQEEQDLEEAVFQSMLDVSKEGVSLMVEASAVGSSKKSRPQVVQNHAMSSTFGVRERGSRDPLVLRFPTDVSSAPVGEEDPGVAVESLVTAGSETIDEDEDMYAPFVGMGSQEDGCNSTSTISEDPTCEASPEAKVDHTQKQATSAGSSQLLRASMEALAQSLKGPIPTSHTPTALSHVTKYLLPAPDLTRLDPPIFIPGLLTQRLFAQSFLLPRLPAAAVVVPNNALEGSQNPDSENPEVSKASDGPLMSPPSQKEDLEMEVVLERSAQDASESTTEVRKASSENHFRPVEETEAVSVQLLTAEVLKNDPVLEQALTTSRLIVDIIRHHQQPKPQAQIPIHDPTPTSMHDHDNAEYSSPDPQVASSEHDAVEPSPPPQSRTRTPASDDVKPVPQAQILIVDSLEPCSQMPSDSPDLQPPTAFIAELHQSQPERELSGPASSSSVSSLATSDESAPPPTPKTSDPYDISHLYIRSMSPDDDGDINPEVYSKILDIPTLPLPETDDDDDVLLSYCFDYPDLDVAG